MGNYTKQTETKIKNWQVYRLRGILASMKVIMAFYPVLAPVLENTKDRIEDAILILKKTEVKR